MDIVSLLPWLVAVVGLFTIYNVVRAGYWRRQDERAKQNHKQAPYRPAVVRVGLWFVRCVHWAKEKWHRLRTPLEDRASIQTIKEEATKTVKAADVKAIDARAYALRKSEETNTVARERDQFRGRESKLTKILTQIAGQPIDSTDTEEKLYWLVTEAPDSLVRKLTEQISRLNTEIEQINDPPSEAAPWTTIHGFKEPTDITAPQTEPEWFLTGDNASGGLVLEHCGGDMARHVNITTDVSWAAVVSGSKDPMNENERLEFTTKPANAYLDGLGEEGVGFWIRWTDNKGVEFNRFRKPYIEPPF